jgi:heme/copper-type cytochrome/quinol oxidase subunit 2
MFLLFLPYNFSGHAGENKNLKSVTSNTTIIIIVIIIIVIIIIIIIIICKLDATNASFLRCGGS